MRKAHWPGRFDRILFKLNILKFTKGDKPLIRNVLSDLQCSKNSHVTQVVMYTLCENSRVDLGRVKQKDKNYHPVSATIDLVEVSVN